MWPASPSWGLRSSFSQQSLQLPRPGTMPHLLDPGDSIRVTKPCSALPPCNEPYAFQALVVLASFFQRKLPSDCIRPSSHSELWLLW